jgi:hypothetical protein
VGRGHTTFEGVSGYELVGPLRGVTCRVELDDARREQFEEEVHVTPRPCGPEGAAAATAAAVGMALRGRERPRSQDEAARAGHLLEAHEERPERANARRGRLGEARSKVLEEHHQALSRLMSLPEEYPHLREGGEDDDGPAPG